MCCAQDRQLYKEPLELHSEEEGGQRGLPEDAAQRLPQLLLFISVSEFQRLGRAQAQGQDTAL